MQIRSELETPVRIDTGEAMLAGDLAVPGRAPGVVIFAHGSGSSRNSPRNRFVARFLQGAGLGTLLLDLLTEKEELIDTRNAQLRFDVDLLARRLLGAKDWLAGAPAPAAIGYFGASTGAAAALIAAAQEPHGVRAVVSRGGRPDLAGPSLAKVTAPTLLIVGGDDIPVIDMNRTAMEELRGEKQLEIVPGATHLFEEPGALERVAELARNWFQSHMVQARSGSAM